MGFDLLANPFAILGLPGNATVSTISSRARELGTGEASAASRILISPRTRLTAELSFLPGATQDQADACLRILKEGGEPDLWPLAPIARANVLAHMASSGAATPSQLRDVVGMQESAPPTAMEAVNRGRSDAGMPPAPPEMAEAALQALAGQHADALVDGLLAHGNGAELLTDFLRGSGGAVTPRSIFLRQCTAGWERAKASDVSRMLESAEALEATLREQPEAETARKLAGLVQELAAATRPQREAARLLGLPHELSLDARRRWQAVALNLNNRLDAIPEAVTVLEALASAFDDPDDLRDRIARNLQVCRERISAGEGTPQIGRLKKAIEAATAQHGEFDRCGLVDGHKTPSCPTMVAELHDSFVAAAGSATSELPWSMLRGLTLLLHNDHNATTAAWSLTVLALAQANRNKAAAPMLAVLTADKQNLRAQLLQREFEIAIRSKRKGAMRTILAELIPLTDAPAEKSEYAKLLRKLRSQAVVAYLKGGFWTAVAGMILLAVLNNEQAPVRTAAAPASFRPAPISTPAPAPSPAPIVTPAPALAPAAMQPVDRTAIQPPPGSSPVSISGLRWCRYQQVRADGAEAYLEALRPDPNLKADRFNAAVAAYNAFVQPLNASCGSFTFRKSDGAIIDAEVNEQRVALTAAGRRAVEIVYLAASAPAAATTLPAYTPTPTYAPASSSSSAQHVQVPLHRAADTCGATA